MITQSAFVKSAPANILKALKRVLFFYCPEPRSLFFYYIFTNRSVVFIHYSKISVKFTTVFDHHDLQSSIFEFDFQT